MKVGIHGKEFKRESAAAVVKIFEILSAQSCELFVTLKFESCLKHSSFKQFKWETLKTDDHLPKLDFFISVGGDGTLLESITYIGKDEVPILGINTGRLGFLATIATQEVEKALVNVLNGAYTVDKRSTIKLETDQPIFGDKNYALNDFTVVKKDTSSMITIHTYIDGEFLNSYWSDGIIVATPTGSTGYSLSCGGPLIFPGSGNFVITPVSPHTLTVRPIIVSDSSEISFQVEGRSRKFLVSLDSRIATVDHNVKLKVSRGDLTVNLIQLKDQHYFKTLRQKLNWGLDIRN
jgi:NAD+ kinase